MNNYRITYAESAKIDYWNKKKQPEAYTSFRDSPNLFWPDLNKIYAKADELGIKYIWHFYEPYVELTWLSDDPEISEKLIEYTKSIIKYDDVKVKRPADGVFADWYCENEREREFGAKRHALCAAWIRLYNEYKEDVDKGKGLDRQVARTIHTLCNPLGLNYKDEARICYSRHIVVKLFRWFPFSVAKWIYVNIFRYKY